MPFFLDYGMLSGVGHREVVSPAAAIFGHAEILHAGGSLITITDHTGRVFSLEEMKTLALKTVKRP